MVLDDVTSLGISQVTSHVSRVARLILVVAFIILKYDDVAAVVTIEISKNVVLVEIPRVGIRRTLNCVLLTPEVLQKVVGHFNLGLVDSLFIGILVFLIRNNLLFEQLILCFLALAGFSFQPFLFTSFSSDSLLFVTELLLTSGGFLRSTSASLLVLLADTLLFLTLESRFLFVFSSLTSQFGESALLFELVLLSLDALLFSSGLSLSFLSRKLICFLVAKNLVLLVLLLPQGSFLLTSTSFFLFPLPFEFGFTGPEDLIFFVSLSFTLEIITRSQLLLGIFSVLLTPSFFLLTTSRLRFFLDAFKTQILLPASFLILSASLLILPADAIFLLALATT